jgi:hypothetical protein
MAYQSALGSGLAQVELQVSCSSPWSKHRLRFGFAQGLRVRLGAFRWRAPPKEFLNVSDGGTVLQF